MKSSNHIHLKEKKKKAWERSEGEEKLFLVSADKFPGMQRSSLSNSCLLKTLCATQIHLSLVIEMGIMSYFPSSQRKATSSSHWVFPVTSLHFSKSSCYFRGGISQFWPLASPAQSESAFPCREMQLWPHFLKPKRHDMPSSLKPLSGMNFLFFLSGLFLFFGI